jgi:hypothetical protein
LSTTGSQTIPEIGLALSAGCASQPEYPGVDSNQAGPPERGAGEWARWEEVSVPIQVLDWHAFKGGMSIVCVGGYNEE